jgi:antitoxin HicB
MRGYEIEASPDGDTFLVTCPALPEVTTFAERLSDVPMYATNAIEEALAARMASWEDAPAPASGGSGDAFAALPAQTALKVELYLDARRKGVTRAELSRRLGWRREQVERLFRLDHASRLDQIEAAFLALGDTVNFSVEPRAPQVECVA